MTASDTRRVARQWLVLAEDNIFRRRTRIFAMKMSAAALALLSVSFWSGYQIRVLQDEPALQSLARCAKTPMRVAIQGQPTGDWVCKLETLARPRAGARWGGTAVVRPLECRDCSRVGSVPAKAIVTGTAETSLATAR